MAAWNPAEGHDAPQLRLNGPSSRPGICRLTQPSLRDQQFTPRFLFQEPTLLLLREGQLELDDGVDRLVVGHVPALLLIESRTSANLVKTPARPDGRFRSDLLELSSSVVSGFQQAAVSAVSTVSRGGAVSGEARHPRFREVPLNEDLSSTLWRALDSIEIQPVSDERLKYRLMDLLAVLAESGHTFNRVGQNSTADQLRTLIGEAPEQRWTTRDAGRALAMSEATLRRRLAHEHTRFEDLLVDVRMHHAMMLLQTTDWDMTHVAEACGYQSRSRFSGRFHARFGYPPSAVR